MSSKISNPVKCFGWCCVLKKGRKDVLRSLRLTEETSRELCGEAERQSVSFSALTTTVLTKYLEYGRFAERYGTLTLSTSTIIAILDELSDETVAKLGKERGMMRPKELLASAGLDSSLGTTVQLVEKYLSQHARWFDCTLREDPDGFLIHLRHHVNRKWSLFLSQYVTSMFREFGFKPTQITINDFTLTLKLAHKS